MRMPSGWKNAIESRLGAVMGIFLLCAAAGWWLEAQGDAGRRLARRSTQEAAPEIHAPVAIAPTDHSESSDFFTRVHVALSLRSREKRRRAISAVAEDLDVPPNPRSACAFGKRAHS